MRSVVLLVFLTGCCAPCVAPVSNPCPSHATSPSSNAYVEIAPPELGIADVLDVILIGKRIVGTRPGEDEFMELEVLIRSNHHKSVAFLEGVLQFIDEDGLMFYEVGNFSSDELIPGKGKYIWIGKSRTRFDEESESDLMMEALYMSEFHSRWIPDRIVFEDGTEMLNP